MRTLVIDSATAACSVALVDGKHVIAGDWRMLGRGHAEQLVPMIASLPERGRAARIAVSTGPGSFTGVRVGLAAAKALAFAWHVELVGYQTPALVAAMARARHGAGAVGTVMTAGHGEWFVQRFDADGRPLAEVVSARPDVALDLLSDDAALAGSAARDAVAARGFGQALELLPDARAFACLPPTSLEGDVTPRYGRAPDARPLAAHPA